MTLPAAGAPGALYIELRKASDDAPIAVMSMIDFRRDFGCRVPEGALDMISALGFDGRRVDVGTAAQLRELLELGDAEVFSRSKVAGR